MTKTTHAPAIPPLSSRACIPAAVLCFILAFFVPGQQAEAFDVRKCIYSAEKAVMYRNSDNRTSCVNLDSVDDLVQRGWGVHDPYDPVVVGIIHYLGHNSRERPVGPIFSQEITRHQYDEFKLSCAKFNAHICEMHLNNGTVQYFTNTEIKKYFTVDWDR